MWSRVTKTFFLGHFRHVLDFQSHWEFYKRTQTHNNMTHTKYLNRTHNTQHITLRQHTHADNIIPLTTAPFIQINLPHTSHFKIYYCNMPFLFQYFVSRNRKYSVKHMTLRWSSHENCEITCCLSPGISCHLKLVLSPILECCTVRMHFFL